MKTALTVILAVLLVQITSISNAQDVFDAIRKGDLVKIRELYAKDTLIIRSRTNTGETPLHLAALQGRPEITDFLCSKGAELNVKDPVRASEPLFQEEGTCRVPEADKAARTNRDNPARLRAEAGEFDGPFVGEG